MANYTPNFNLMKPLGSENYNVSQQNGNMDKIDTSLQGLGNGLGIIANGNTHAAISSGEYVYVHGHGTLAEGLYKATANIGVNGSLTTSNLSFLPNGIGGSVSELNSKINNLIEGKTLSGTTSAGGNISTDYDASDYAVIACYGGTAFGAVPYTNTSGKIAFHVTAITSWEPVAETAVYIRYWVIKLT